VLYRVAEVMEGRRAQFADEVAASEGLTPSPRGPLSTQAIDRWVWYAGWSDKLAQVARRAQPGRRAVLQHLGA
jgi:acyl-CoA reductase-like NAD-dependent aldehyde dehydrogenase